MRIKPEQVGRKDGSLITTRSCPDFHDHIALITRIFGQQHAFDLTFQSIDLRFQVQYFCFCQHAHIDIIAYRARNEHLPFFQELGGIHALR